MRSFPAVRANTVAVSTPQKRSSTHRIIRKTPLWERIKDLPENILLNLELDALLLDFSAFGWPIGISLHAAHFLLKFSTLGAFLADSGRRRLKGLTIADAHLQELQNIQKGSTFANFLTYCSLSLILLSCLNTLYLFTRRRAYRLHHRKDPVKSKNARLVPADLGPSQESWLKLSINLLSSWIRRKKVAEPDMVQQLDVWTPQDLYLHIFALYPPPTALLWHVVNGSNWWYMLLAIAMIVVQSNLVIAAFSNLLVDRGIIQAEVMHEYDSTFVYPRIFRPTRDAGTMTNEAEIIDWRVPRYVEYEYQEPARQQYTDYQEPAYAQRHTPRRSETIERSGSRRSLVNGYAQPSLPSSTSTRRILVDTPTQDPQRRRKRQSEMTR